MAWLESHGNLARHPKTRRLMQRMGWTLPTTIGNLHLLWYWALEYAPTGNLTKFEPDQLTCDLDLGDATPEQFIQAMVEAGFIDHSEERTLRLHDWPDYTAKSLRPRFRRNPDRWHQVLRSYGRPIPPKRQRRAPSLPGFQLPPAEAGENQHSVVPPRRDAPEQLASSRATREPKLAEYEAPGATRIDCVEDTAREGVGSGSDRSQLALRAGRSIAQIDSIPQTGNEPDPQAPQSSPSFSTRTTSDLFLAPIPQVLHALPSFYDLWWSMFLDKYRNHGRPLTAAEQTSVLAQLAKQPFTAVAKLKLSIENFPNSHPIELAVEHLGNTT